MPIKKVSKGLISLTDFTNYVDRTDDCVHLINPPYSKIEYSVKVEDDKSITITGCKTMDEVEMFVDVEIPSLPLEYLQKEIDSSFKFEEGYVKSTVNLEYSEENVNCTIAVFFDYHDENSFEFVLTKLDNELENTIFEWQEINVNEKKVEDNGSFIYKTILEITIKN